MPSLERIVESIPYPVQDVLIVLVALPLWSAMFAVTVAALTLFAGVMFWLGAAVAGGS